MTSKRLAAINRRTRILQRLARGDAPKQIAWDEGVTHGYVLKLKPADHRRKRRRLAEPEVACAN